MGAAQQALASYGTAGGITPIAPNAITGLKLWLDAQVGLTKSNAARFKAANSEYLSRTSNTDLQTGDVDFTLAVWAYFDTLPSAATLISKDNASSARDYHIAYFSSIPALQFALFKSGNSQVQVRTGQLTAKTWYLVFAWYDSAADTINISLNDGTTISASSSGALQAPTAAEFQIGGLTAAGALYHDGKMQNAVLWKRLLTPTERTSIYNAGAGKNYSALTSGEKASMTSWWALDELSSTRADSHGSNSLTDNNTVTRGAGIVLGGAAGNGDAIGKWADQSPLATDFVGAQGGAVCQTSVAGIGGGAEVVFAAVDTLVSSAAAAQKPITYAFVARVEGAGNRTMVGSGTASSGSTLNFGGTGASQLLGNGTGIGAGVNAWASGAYHVGVITWDGSNTVVYYFDGPQESTTSSATTPSAGSLILGAADNSLFGPFTGGMVELVKYDNAISTADRKGLIKYLGNKYGLTVNP